MNYLVIKCGGSAFEKLPETFYEDIVRLQKSGQWKPVIVHGGGPLINNLLNKMGIQSHFVNGLRVTTAEMLDVVEMVLSGSVNKRIVRLLKKASGNGFGLSGVDGSLIEAKQIDPKLGYVGEVTGVKKTILEDLCAEGMIPVISPIAIDAEGTRYNVNGDIAASAVAKALSAKFCLISDIPGILVEQGGEQQVLTQATKAEIEALIKQEVITGGMIPKVQAALDGLAHHVPEAVILNGLEAHSLYDFCQGKKIGTRIVLGEEVSHGQ
jgi:acetylglutamate kinase